MLNHTSVTFTVTTVLHRGRFGGGVFTGYDEQGHWIKVIADSERMPNPPTKGEVCKLIGVFTNHPTHGVQLQVKECCLIRPSGKLLIRFLCTHPSFRGIGIGPAKASRLYERFGEGLKQVLDTGDIEALVSVLSFETAEKLVEAWRNYNKEVDVVAFLDRHGVDVRLSNKIMRYWPEKTVEKLQENPYRLLPIVNWNIVDKLARSIGIDARDRRRLIAATEAVVYNSLDSAKDTLMSESSLCAGLCDILRSYDDKVIRAAIEHAVDDRAVVGDTEFGYQAFGCAVMERLLMDRFGAMARRKNSQPSLFASSDRIASLIRDFEQENEISLNDEQRAAVMMAATEPLSVITGGAGVGKTTVLKTVYYVVEASGGAVIQMALAGRAAQRMREATGKQAYTIAAFLNQIHSGKIKLDDSHLLIIDEASMLDLMLMCRVVKVMPRGVRLLLVGDPYQLPPIGPGLVFHAMSRSASLQVQELIQVHRQTESTGIPAVASMVRNGIVPELPSFVGSGFGVSFRRCAPDSVINDLIHIIESLGGFKDTQIIGVTKNGSAGVTNINQAFHQKLTSKKPKLYEWEIAESDPVIYTVNNYDRELFNGSLGRVKAVLDGAQNAKNEQDSARLVCDFEGREITLSDSDLGNIELAYAITTHKAQGSQFKRVVIPITKSRLLDRTLVYTALTRGVEQVIFLGDKRAFDEAVKNAPSASLRKVGFVI